jgi:hypothetical protein
MADNPLIDLAQTVMVEKYGLDEHEYSLFKFSEGQKNITVGMSNGDIPVTASFPREFLRFEEMKRWDYPRKELFVKGLIKDGLEFPEELEQDAEFNQIFIRQTMGTEVIEMSRGDKATVKISNGEISVEKSSDSKEVAEEPKEETAEEFEKKVNGKKKKPVKKRLKKAQ